MAAIKSVEKCMEPVTKAQEENRLVVSQLPKETVERVEELRK
jgi:hypothetical protein